MSEFSRKVYQMIGEYRTILRKSLPQFERMKKLDNLRLKVKLDSTTEFEFFQIAQGIIKEETTQRNQRDGSYYSYSGVDQFCKCLKDFVDQYAVDNGRVVHVSQFSSNSFLYAVQLLSVEHEEVTDEMVSRLQHCNQVIAKYAELETCQRYLELLRHQQHVHADRFTSLVLNFKQLLQQQGRNLLDAQVDRVA
ncbi:MAG: hypothetical protein P1U40_01835 [Coxiellaceae bacterium]|nr:hypothetical protein [Coxiellaceae bacterium]